jgi:hypothetical protein
MYFVDDNNVTLLDAHVQGLKNHFFAKVTNDCPLIHGSSHIQGPHANYKVI